MTAETNTEIVLFSESVENPDLNAVRYLRRRFEALDTKSMPHETREAFSFFVSETVTNLIEHTTSTPTKITLELVTSAGAWICRVIDDGPTFEGFDAQLAIALEKWNSSQGFLESGIGLALITKMLPDHWYTPSADRSDATNSFSVRYPARRSVVNRPRIVIVDDDDDIRTTIRLVLRRDYLIRSFPDAVTALNEFHDGPVDLVISDIRMPEMDGLSFRQALVDQGDDLIPFIFLTGESDADVSRQADELGIDDYIEKPIDGRRLISTVRRLLLRRNMIQERYLTEMSRELTDTLTTDVPASFGVVECAVERRVPSAGGGDLIIPIGADGIFIADVMGHGLRAKMVAHAVSAYARSQLLRMGENWSPQELMAGISEAIHVDASLDAVIVTGILIRISPDGRIRISSAGHPLPIVLTSHQHEYVEVGGPLLGLTRNQTYGETELSMAPGTALLVMTDGLFEVGPDIEKQRDAERDVCQTGVNAVAESFGAQEIATAVIAAYDRITDNTPTDDTTVFIAKR